MKWWRHCFITFFLVYYFFFGARLAQPSSLKSGYRARGDADPQHRRRNGLGTQLCAPDFR